jgi:hypothetical protein
MATNNTSTCLTTTKTAAAVAMVGAQDATSRAPGMFFPGFFLYSTNVYLGIDYHYGHQQHPNMFNHHTTRTNNYHHHHLDASLSAMTTTTTTLAHPTLLTTSTVPHSNPYHHPSTSSAPPGLLPLSISLPV